MEVTDAAMAAVRHEAERGGVLPESWLNLPHRGALLRYAPRWRSRPSRRRCCRARTDASSYRPTCRDRTSRNVVDDDRNTDGVVDRLEAGTSPGGLVVVGRHDQHGIGARPCACRASSIASLVEFEPAPAITGTRPLAARCTTARSVRARRATASGSPVVPTGTRPLCPRQSASPPDRGRLSRQARHC